MFTILKNVIPKFKPRNVNQRVPLRLIYCGWVQCECSDANAMFVILFFQKTKPLTPDMMQKVLKSAIQLVLFCPHKYFHVKLQEKLTVGKWYFEYKTLDFY